MTLIYFTPASPEHILLSNGHGDKFTFAEGAQSFLQCSIGRVSPTMNLAIGILNGTQVISTNNKTSLYSNDDGTYRAWLNMNATFSRYNLHFWSAVYPHYQQHITCSVFTNTVYIVLTLLVYYFATNFVKQILQSEQYYLWSVMDGQTIPSYTGSECAV